MLKTRLSTIAMSTLFVTVLAVTPMAAQNGDDARPIGFGPLVGFNFDGSNPFIGGAFRMGTPWMLGENPLMFDADFEYLLDTGPVTIFSVQAALLMPFVLENSPVKPVVGAGLNIQRASVDTGISNFSASSTNIHLALIGGIMVRAFFADLMLRVGSGSGLGARAGFLLLGNIL